MCPFCNFERVHFFVQWLLRYRWRATYYPRPSQVLNHFYVRKKVRRRQIKSNRTKKRNEVRLATGRPDQSKMFEPYGLANPTPWWPFLILKRRGGRS